MISLLCFPTIWKYANPNRKQFQTTIGLPRSCLISVDKMSPYLERLARRSSVTLWARACNPVCFMDFITPRFSVRQPLYSNHHHYHHDCYYDAAP